MANANTPKTARATRTAAPVQEDAEMERLVEQAEREFTERQQAQLVDLIDAGTRGVLVLFPYEPRTRQEGKTYPVMTGQLETKRACIPVSAFAKKTEEGRSFLSLAIGPKDQIHIGGAVFRQEEQNQANGLWELTPGKENERHGVIAKTERIEGSDEYETVFQLRFYGKRRMSAAGVPYIKAQVYPERKGDDTTAQAMEACF